MGWFYRTIPRNVLTDVARMAPIALVLQILVHGLSHLSAFLGFFFPISGWSRRICPHLVSTFLFLFCFLQSSPRLLEGICLWSLHAPLSNRLCNLRQVRVLAYLRIKQLATVLPFPFVDACMKGLYLAFAKRARSPPVSSAAKLSMKVMEGWVCWTFLQILVCASSLVVHL